MLGQGKKSKSTTAKVDTIIGQQTRIEGDVHFSGGLHVDGRIKGGVIADSDSTSVLTDCTAHPPVYPGGARCSRRV